MMHTKNLSTHFFKNCTHKKNCRHNFSRQGLFKSGHKKLKSAYKMLKSAYKKLKSAYKNPTFCRNSAPYLAN